MGRVTMTTSTTASYALISSGAGTAAQMAFDNLGMIIVGDATSDQVVQVDPATGVVTAITSGPQPWGTNLNAMSVHPVTQDIYVGGNGSIWIIPAGTTTPALFATGWTAGTSFVSGIDFDIAAGDVLATLLSVNRAVRIDALGTVTDINPLTAVTGPNSLKIDPNGGDVFVGSGTATITRLPAGGGPPVVETSGGGNNGSVSGLAIVGSSVPSLPSVTAYGTGCTSAGGITTIASTGLPFLGNPTFFIDLTGGPPSGQAYMFLALAPNIAGLPIGGGCNLYLDPNAMIMAINAGVSPIGPLPMSPVGSTTFVLSVPNDPAAAGINIYLQCAAIDATGAVRTSNGLDALLN